MTRPRVVACPICGTAVEWTVASRWRPFCSERCKTIDLGAWATERYRVAVTEAPDPADGDLARDGERGDPGAKS